MPWGRKENSVELLDLPFSPRRTQYTGRGRVFFFSSSRFNQWCSSDFSFTYHTSSAGHVIESANLHRHSEHWEYKLYCILYARYLLRPPSPPTPLAALFKEVILLAELEQQNFLTAAKKYFETSHSMCTARSKLQPSSISYPLLM